MRLHERLKDVKGFQLYGCGTAGGGPSVLRLQGSFGPPALQGLSAEYPIAETVVFSWGFVLISSLAFIKCPLTM